MDMSGIKNILIDGTFLAGRTGTLVVMNAQNHNVIVGQYGIAENSEAQVIRFLESLKLSGLKPISCTTDGSPQVIKVVRALWPGIITQRCIVHVQRQGLMWCRRYPKRNDAKQLRNLFLCVTSVSRRKEQEVFLANLSSWEDRYGANIQSSSDNDKVFSDVKRARSMLLKALPNMFHYLDNSEISKSTNGIEGYFSRLKQHYRQHRGLSQKRRLAYLSWYSLLCSR